MVLLARASSRWREPALAQRVHGSGDPGRVRPAVRSTEALNAEHQTRIRTRLGDLPSDRDRGVRDRGRDAPRASGARRTAVGGGAPLGGSAAGDRLRVRARVRRRLPGVGDLSRGDADRPSRRAPGPAHQGDRRAVELALHLRQRSDGDGDLHLAPAGGLRADRHRGRIQRHLRGRDPRFLGTPAALPAPDPAGLRHALRHALRSPRLLRRGVLGLLRRTPQRDALRA